MYSYNKVILVGRLTRDPEFKYVLEGVPLSTYFLAVDRPYRNSQTSETDFFKIVCWRKRAEFADRYLRKGKQILVEGYLQCHNYEKNGQTHFVTEVIAENIKFISPKGDNNSNGSEQNNAYLNEEVNEEFTTGELEEIPF